jgi:hypothetical protein
VAGCHALAVLPVQKRKATENVRDGFTGTDDGDRGRALKRHKSDAVHPHPDFWYPDGSVIIQVENTKFRLHQSILEKKSAYFAAAFAKDGGRAYLEVEIDAQSPNGHHLPVYRVRLPAYHVVETTADDFAMLLTVIEEPMCFSHAGQMPTLAGVLRAARALSFEATRKRVERHFKGIWPAELDDLTRDPMPHAPVALALARTCGLRSVQKRASYEILRMPTFWQAIDTLPEAHVAMDELAGANLLTLPYVREQLALAWAEIAGRAPIAFVHPQGTQMQIMPKSGGGRKARSNPDGHLSSCTSANADRVHARWAERVHMTELYVQRMNDPLMGLQDLMEIPWMEKGFCNECVAAATKMWDGLRRNLWNDLEVWLELDD